MSDNISNNGYDSEIYYFDGSSNSDNNPLIDTFQIVVKEVNKKINNSESNYTCGFVLKMYDMDKNSWVTVVDTGLNNWLKNNLISFDTQLVTEGGSVTGDSTLIISSLINEHTLTDISLLEHYLVKYSAINYINSDESNSDTATIKDIDYREFSCKISFGYGDNPDLMIKDLMSAIIEYSCNISNGVLQYTIKLNHHLNFLSESIISDSEVYKVDDSGNKIINPLLFIKRVFDVQAYYLSRSNVNNKLYKVIFDKQLEPYIDSNSTYIKYVFDSTDESDKCFENFSNKNIFQLVEDVLSRTMLKEEYDLMIKNNKLNNSDTEHSYLNNPFKKTLFDYYFDNIEFTEGSTTYNGRLIIYKYEAVNDNMPACVFAYGSKGENYKFLKSNYSDDHKKYDESHYSQTAEEAFPIEYEIWEWSNERFGSTYDEYLSSIDNNRKTFNEYKAQYEEYNEKKELETNFLVIEWKPSYDGAALAGAFNAMKSCGGKIAIQNKSGDDLIYIQGYGNAKVSIANENSVDYQSAQEYTKWANSTQKITINSTVTLYGLPVFIPINTKIRIEVFIGYQKHHTSGDYVITGVKHSINNSGFTTVLQVIRSPLQAEYGLNPLYNPKTIKLLGAEKKFETAMELLNIEVAKSTGFSYILNDFGKDKDKLDVESLSDLNGRINPYLLIQYNKLLTSGKIPAGFEFYVDDGNNIWLSYNNNESSTTLIEDMAEFFVTLDEYNINIDSLAIDEGFLNAYSNYRNSTTMGGSVSINNTGELIADLGNITGNDDLINIDLTDNISMDYDITEDEPTLTHNNNRHWSVNSKHVIGVDDEGNKVTISNALDSFKSQFIQAYTKYKDSDLADMMTDKLDNEGSHQFGVVMDKLEQGGTVEELASYGYEYGGIISMRDEDIRLDLNQNDGYYTAMVNGEYHIGFIFQPDKPTSSCDELPYYLMYFTPKQ